MEKLRIDNIYWVSMQYLYCLLELVVLPPALTLAAAAMPLDFPIDLESVLPTSFLFSLIGILLELY